MEVRKYEEVPQKSEVLKCEHISSGIEKPSSLSLSSSQIFGSETLDTNIATPTPQKTYEPVRNCHEDEATELPENYKVIAEFFNCMTCSLRLLALRKKLPTFEIISRQIGIISGRTFSCKHLAQIKHILPEAVHIDKVLIRDKKTLCVKSDIKISLTFDVIEVQQEESPFIALQQLFMSRLLNMATKLPAVCEIPEAEMPKRFNQESNSIKMDAMPVDLSTESQNHGLEDELLSNSTHLCSSFNRSFSKKMVEETKKKTPLLASQIPTSSSSHECSIDQHIRSNSRLVSVSVPVQLAQPSSSIVSPACETTPLKVAVETGDITLQTPALLTPRRSVPSCDNKLKIMTGQTVTPYSAKRSLDFSGLEGEENVLNSTSDEIDCLNSWDQKSQQTIAPKGLFTEENFSYSAACLAKEEKSLGFTQDFSINQTGVAGLSDFITLIHQTFQSVNRSSITKDELIYKIMINSCDIVERREIEKQIGLLEKLVPDWICSNLEPSGDVLCNIKKHADPNSVTRSLYEQMTKTTTEDYVAGDTSCSE